MNAAERENARNAFKKASANHIRGDGFDWALEYSYPEAPNDWIQKNNFPYSAKEIDWALKHARIKYRNTGMKFRGVKKVTVTYTRTYIKL